MKELLTATAELETCERCHRSYDPEWDTFCCLSTKQHNPAEFDAFLEKLELLIAPKIHGKRKSKHEATQERNGVRSSLQS